MPEMDGFEATIKIRELLVPPGSKQPTIVALTASALSHERKRCEEVGMDVFLTKPIRPADFEAFLLDEVSKRTSCPRGTPINSMANQDPQRRQ